MPLIQLINVSVSYGGPPVLSGITFAIEPGERIALVGRNGEGKSTLMNTITGELKPDSGNLLKGTELVVRHLPQEVPGDIKGSVFDVAASGLGATGKLIADYHHVTHQMAEAPTDAKLMDALETLMHAIEQAEAWDAHTQVENILTRMALNPEDDFAALSGGMKRRVLLARALSAKPDLLLLDEPTNHLDIEAILWLEKFLLGYAGAILFVTHDRAFLEKLATRIVELDRGKLSSWPGNYTQYLEGKEQLLAAEEKQNALFDKRLAQEEAWIRQGIKARRTRNEGRVRALIKMREERRKRLDRKGSVKMAIDTGGRSGQEVIVAEDVSFRHKGAARDIVRGFSTTVMRGEKVGIVGRNGVGKTTLLKLLLGETSPTRGRVTLGTNINIAYFDQLRGAIDGEKTVRENLTEGGSETILVGGRSVHAVTYLREFLFEPARIRVPAKVLSGGERARLILAKLFARPANLIVLDEPTNDLDMDTLEILEALLVDYPGTALIVSHDRVFLNNVATAIFALPGDGTVTEHVGGYDDYLREMAEHEKPAAQTPRTPASPPAPAPALPPAPKPRKKRPFREEQELAALPAKIEALEIEIKSLQLLAADPAFYRKPAADQAETHLRLAHLEAELDTLFARWDELDGRGTAPAPFSRGG